MTLMFLHWIVLKVSRLTSPCKCTCSYVHVLLCFVYVIIIYQSFYSKRELESSDSSNEDEEVIDIR